MKPSSFQGGFHWRNIGSRLSGARELSQDRI
jgi:hypothetical protein